MSLTRKLLLAGLIMILPGFFVLLLVGLGDIAYGVAYAGVAALFAALLVHIAGRGKPRSDRSP